MRELFFLDICINLQAIAIRRITSFIYGNPNNNTNAKNKITKNIAIFPIQLFCK